LKFVLRIMGSVTPTEHFLVRGRAAVYDYFFSGNQYIRVIRGDTGPGVVDVGYPKTISPNWGWGSFGANGIDAALYSGSKCYFFAGGEYIRVTRGVTGPGTIDPGYPRPIAPNWGWGAFGASGIDAALYSNSKCYFFSGNQYIRVTRGETGPGTVDAGYPRPISVWNWGSFGADGIDAALYSGSRCYFFSNDQYIRVTRGVPKWIVNTLKAQPIRSKVQLRLRLAR
jgi:ribulose bisphosphate carboxylase small subunit